MTAVDIVAIGERLSKKGKAGRPPRDPDEWETAFLDYYARRGNAHRAAKLAGVSINTVLKRRRTSPAFLERYRTARREFIAGLEEQLVELGYQRGNVIAILARLKASGRQAAERYSEKAVDARVMNLTLNVGAPSAAADADAALARMLARQSPLELKALAGEILDIRADPPAALAYSSPPEEEA